MALHAQTEPTALRATWISRVRARHVRQIVFNLAASALVATLLATPSAWAQSKRDVRGYAPGDATRDVLARAQASGLTCRKSENLSYVNCANGLNQYTDTGFEEFEFYAIGEAVSTVVFRFKSGNDFRALVGWVSKQFSAPPCEVSYFDIARWRLPDGSTLEFRKLAESAVLTLANPQVR